MIRKQVQDFLRRFRSSKAKAIRQRISRIEQLEARQMMAAAVWTNVLQPLDVTADAEAFITPKDVLLVINELNNPFYSNPSTRQLPDVIADGSNPPYIDVSCDGFVTPRDALLVINRINSPTDAAGNASGSRPTWSFDSSGGTASAKSRVSSNACSPRLYEGDSYRSQLSTKLVLPDSTSAVMVQFNPPSFDLRSKNTIRDAFEIAVLDASGQPLVLPHAPGRDTAFNWSEDLDPSIGPATQYVTGTATINLAGIAGGTVITVVARMVNNDSDNNSSITLREIQFVDSQTPTPVSFRPLAESAGESSAPELTQLVDVSSSVLSVYGRTTLSKQDKSLLSTELQLFNSGTYPIVGSLVAVLDKLSDPSVGLINPDGFTPDGRPYLNFTNEMGNSLAPGGLTASRSVQFKNLTGERFTYEFQILSGLNQAPQIESIPDAIIAAGDELKVQVRASDPEGRSLTYKLQMAPQGMTIDSASGFIRWTPQAADIGNAQVHIRVEDPLGGTSSSSFAVSVRATVANRPPIITSTPETDAVVSSPFEVQTYATGLRPVAVDVLVQPNGTSSLVTANEGDQQFGYLAGGSRGFGSSQPISIGEPHPSHLSTPFHIAYPVDLGFAPNTIGNFQRDIQGVLSEDLNSDGNPDLIVLANRSASGNWNDPNDRGHVIVQLGNGDGTFREGWTASLPVVAGRIGRAASAHLKDVTGDGRRDLIVTTIATNRTLVYPGSSSTLFDATPIVSANDGNFVVNSQLADLNADGKLDLVLFENVQVQISGRQGIGIQLGDGSGRFTGSTLVSATNNNGGYGYVVDVDGINGPDLVRLNYSDTRIEVRLNDGSGQFGDVSNSITRTYYSSANTGARNINPTSAYIDDFDGDGKADALFSSPQGIALLKGQGNGQFGNDTQSGNAIAVIDNFDDPRWPGIAHSDGRGRDLNGDGKLDFVFGGMVNTGNIMIGLGNGTGTFGIQQYNASFENDIGQGIVRNARTVQYIAVADFNRDGAIDLAAGASQHDQQPGAVGIFLGDLPGTLRAPNFVTSYAYNQDYSAVKGRSDESVTGDFNGDGYVDIVTSGGAGFGTAFFFAAGKGDGTFAPYQSAMGGILGDDSLIALDIDRDGILDLAWMDGNRFGQAFGLGNGAFQYLPTVPSPNGGPAGVSKQILQTDDFNRDGYPDLVYRLQTGHIDINLNTKIVVLLYDPANRRYRELADSTNLITTTPRAYGFYHDEALGMGDLNGDGTKEFFAFSRNNPNNGTPSRFSIYEQTGNAGNDASALFRKTVIENPSFIPPDQAHFSYVVEDFNRDGKNDIAYTSSAYTVVMFGSGDFTFSNPTTYLTNGFLMNDGDFNGDGLTDLATTWGYGFISHSQRPFNGVLLGRADGTFSEHYGYTISTAQTNGLFVGDFNGDGVDDLTGLGGFRHNEVFIGKTKGLTDIATGDVNGDGRPDSVSVVAGLDRVKLLHGVIDETFARQPDLFTDLFPVAVELVDADDDDLLDILTANQVGKSLSLFKHTSPTTFARTDIDLPVRPTDLVLGDINGDGKVDAVAISSIDQTLVGLLAGNENFAIGLVLPLGFSPSGVAAGDVSGDGKLDLVVSDSDGDRLIVLQGRGDGTFLAPFVIPVIHAPGAVGIADLNDDSRRDIVVAQPENDRVALLFNRGNGRFTSPQFIQVGDQPVAVQIRDVNNDSKPDILVPNQDENTISVILNRFDPNQVWTYKPTATDPDGDLVTFDLTSAPGGMLYDSASNTIYWAPMPEQIGVNSIVLTASDGNGGSTDQGFVVTVTAPVTVVPPIFTSTPVTTFGADSIYRYEPNVQAEENGPKRFSIVQGPAGMTIDPTTGVLEWENRSEGIKLFANYSDPGSPVSNQNNGQIQIADSPSLRSASVTAEGWFNFEDPRGAVWEQLLSKQVSATNSATPSWGLEYYYGTLRAHVGKPGQSTSLATITAPAPIENNKWVHIALTFDDSSKILTLYVNGKSVGSAVSPESIGYNALPLVSGSNYITLSRVKVWNKARSASEIASQALADIPSNTPDLILDLKFQESKVVSTLLDASNAKNHGRLIGTPDFVNYPLRVPALASQGNFPVTIRVEDGKGGVTEQSFSVSVKAPTTTHATGVVFDDVNGNGTWDRRAGENFAFNGDFGSGAVGFTTDFIQRNNANSFGWLGNSQSTVSNTTGTFPNTPFYTDHTYGSASDFMLLANGETQDRVAWRQTIPTISGQSYDFSFWAIRANSYEAPRLAVRVNGQTFGTTLSLNDVGLNTWKRFLGTLQADSSTTLIEIVLLGSTTAPNPGLSGAENVVGIDDILLLSSSSRRLVVSGKANPYLADMPDGSTAFSGTAPQASPPSMSMSAGQVLRFSATGHTVADGFIGSRSSDGIVYNSIELATQSALNGISQFSSPRHGSLIGVFLDDSSPAGQTPPAPLDFKESGNVPGGINYTSLQPALRQVFFIGDGRTADGVEQTITVPAGATRLFFANSSTNGWNSNSGEFEVQVFDSVTEPTKTNRQVFVDSNFNGRLDASEPSTLTNARGVYALPIPGTTAQLGLVGKEGELQTAPGIPYRTFDSQTDVLPIDFGSRDVAMTESPRFTTQPVTEATAPGAYRYQSFAQSPSGKPMTYALAVGPQGMSIDPSSGLVRWNPIASNRGDNDVILKATDADGKVTLQRYAIHVDVNTIPMVTSLPPARAPQGIPFEYQVLTQDAEQADLRYSLTTAPVGMTIDPTTGLMRWLPSTLGTQNVTVRVEDQRGGSTEHAFSLAVEAPGTNHSPQLISGPRTKAVLGREFASRIIATDEDNDVLTYTLVSGPNGLTVSSRGEIFWQPSLTGSFDFVARVSDNRGGTHEQSYNLSVVSRAPSPDLQITSSPTTAAIVGDLFAYDVVAKNGELFELMTSPAGMSIAPARGTIRWVPTKDQLGVQTVKIRVSDVLGNTAEQSFVVAVRSSSLVPTISSAPLTEGAVGQTYIYAVSVANPSKSPLTHSLPVAPSGMQIDPALGVITWTPVSGQIGSSVVSIQVRDAVGNFSSQTFSLVVSAGAINRPPVLATTPSIDAVVGQPYAYTMVANDPEGAAVTYAVRSAPNGFSINLSTGVVTWTPSASDIGTASVVLTATDPLGGVAVQTIQIDVRDANRLPAIRSNPSLKVSQGAVYQYDVIATDPDREPLFYSLVTAPVGMAIDALGRIRWQTQLDTPLGGRDVVVRVVDGLGGETTQSYAFGVVPDTLAPRITIIVGGEAVLYPWTTAPAIVRVIAADDVGLTNVELKVDGQSVELAADGTARVYFSAPGNGRLQAIATDAAGNQGTALARVSMRSGEEDGGGNPAPEATITSVTDGLTVGGFVNVIGTAAAPDFERYVLSYRRIDQSDYKTILNGTTQVTAASLGKWDTTLLENDNYVLKLEVYDTFGSFAAVEVEVSVSSNLKLGNFRLSFEDMTIPVAGIPITIVRTYDTLRADRDGDFGYGWRLEYRNTDLRTSLPKSGLEDIGIYTPFKQGTKVFLTLPGGEREGFTFTPEIKVLPGFGRNNNLVLASPRFTPDRGVTSTLSAGGGQLVVNEFGELYAAGGIPWNPAAEEFGGYKLSTKDGLQYQIDGASGLMTSATDRNGYSVSFSNSGIRSANGIDIEIQRNAQGRISAILDPSGSTVTYAYSGSGNLVSTRDRKGNESKLEYRTASHELVRVIDPLGRTGIRVEYDANGKLIKAVGGDGAETRFTYDTEASLYTVTDALGRTTTTEYDDFGNPVAIVDALGGVRRTTFDNSGRATSETDPIGRTTHYAYDAGGNVIEIVDPIGSKHRATFDRFGNETSRVDSLGNVISTVYDSKGNLVTVTDPAGNTTTIQATGGRAHQVNSPAGLTYSFAYGNRDEITSSTDFRGHTVNVLYNSLGLPIQSTYSTIEAGQAVTVTESTTYDSNGRRLSFTNAAGAIERFEYDAAGQLTAEIDGLGRRTEFEYDSAGRGISRKRPDGAIERSLYDVVGQLVATTDAAGRMTRYGYDATGRKIETIFPDATIEDLSDNPRILKQYDLAGQEIAVVDETGVRSSKTYDAAGRIVSTQNAAGGVVTFTYDSEGNPTKWTDELGRITHYQYNALGQVVASIKGDGTRITYSYDAHGHRTKVVDESGNETSYEYAGDGKLISVTDALGNKTSYQYDVRGNLQSVTNANMQLTRYSHDRLGRETIRKLPGGQNWLTQYDAVGNVVQTTDPDSQVIRLEYDSMDRLAKKTVDQVEYVYVYTATGQLRSVTDNRGTTRFEYDERDRMIVKTEPDGQSIRYAYDKAGRRLTLTSAAGVEAYSYDSLGRLATVTSPQGQITKYTYDLSDALTKTEYHNGVIEDRQFDGLGRLVRITARKESNVISDYRYALDASGRVTRAVEIDGKTTDYAYDASQRLVAETVTQNGNSRTTQYTFDPFGNRLSMIDPNGTTTYQYDSNDRLVRSVRGGISSTYTYNRSGDLIRVESPGERLENAWDSQHRLLSSKRQALGVEQAELYRYDADGNRVAIIDVSGNERRLLVDNSGEQAELVAEYSANGVVLTQYTRGLELISQSAGSNVSSYLLDRLGSVRTVLDASGAAIANYSYDAYGVLLGGATNTGSPQFTGEPLSQLSQYTYLRARYYDAAVGRFVSSDPFAGVIDSPISLHKYAYAFLDPTNLVDASGNFPTLTEISYSLSIISSLAAVGSIVANLAGKTEIAHWLDIVSYVGLFGSIATYSGTLALLKMGPSAFKLSVGAAQKVGSQFFLGSVNQAAKSTSEVVYKKLLDVILKAVKNGSSPTGVASSGRTVAKQFVQIVDDGISEYGFKYLGKPVREIFAAAAKRQIPVFKSWAQQASKNSTVFFEAFEKELELLLL